MRHVPGCEMGMEGSAERGFYWSRLLSSQYDGLSKTDVDYAVGNSISCPTRDPAAVNFPKVQSHDDEEKEHGSVTKEISLCVHVHSFPFAQHPSPSSLILS